MNDIERAIIGVSIDLVDRIKDLAELRGHNLTGKMIASVMQETVASAMGIRTSFKIIDYGITVDSGIDAAMVNSWSAEKKKQVVNALYFYHKLRRNENPYKRALITMKKWEKEGARSRVKCYRIAPWPMQFPPPSPPLPAKLWP